MFGFKEIKKLAIEKAKLEAQLEYMRARLEDVLSENASMKLTLDQERNFWKTEFNALIGNLPNTGTVSPDISSSLKDMIGDEATDEEIKKANENSQQFLADFDWWHTRPLVVIEDGKGQVNE